MYAYVYIVRGMITGKGYHPLRNKIKRGNKNMRLSDAAKAYEPTTATKVISDLDSVSLQVDMIPKVFKEGQVDEYTQDVITIDGEDYRVPKTVQAQLKTMIESGVKFDTFEVVRTGTTMSDTVYTVIPHAQA